MIKTRNSEGSQALLLISSWKVPYELDFLRYPDIENHLF
jgi:hypothetical protein